MTVRECTWDGTHGGDVTVDWIEKSKAFLDQAFAKAKGACTTWSPCNSCANMRRQTKKVLGKRLCKNEFTTNYH